MGKCSKCGGKGCPMCGGLRHDYGDGDQTFDNKHEFPPKGKAKKQSPAPEMVERPNKSDPRNAGPKGKNPAEGHGEGGGDESMPDTSDGSSNGYAGKPKHGAKPKGGAVTKHGEGPWKEHGGKPFDGAAPPIHKQKGGKFVKKAKK